MMDRNVKLQERLDALSNTYHAEYLYSDPLKYLHRYTRPDDREVVGLLVSSLAYGRVVQIFKSVEYCLDRMGPAPANYVRNFDPKRDSADFDSFVHRFNRGVDISCLLWFMKQILNEHGSLFGLFEAFSEDGDGDMGNMLNTFTRHVLSLDCKPFYGSAGLPGKAGVRYFFPSPKDGGPCKRLNLFLRWMVRKNDGLDLGLWNFIPPSKLIIPLDTHVARLSRYLGLTARKSPSWKMALEVTENLKQLDPDDPLKYDFALARLGILDFCPQKRDPAKCLECGIKDICTL